MFFCRHDHRRPRRRQHLQRPRNVQGLPAKSGEWRAHQQWPEPGRGCPCPRAHARRRSQYSPNRRVPHRPSHPKTRAPGAHRDARCVPPARPSTQDREASHQFRDALRRANANGPHLSPDRPRALQRRTARGPARGGPDSGEIRHHRHGALRSPRAPARWPQRCVGAREAPVLRSRPGAPTRSPTRRRIPDSLSRGSRQTTTPREPGTALDCAPRRASPGQWLCAPTHRSAGLEST